MKPILAILICCLPLCACQTGKTPTAQPQAQETAIPAHSARYATRSATVIHSKTLLWDANASEEHVDGYCVYWRKTSLTRWLRLAWTSAPQQVLPPVTYPVTYAVTAWAGGWLVESDKSAPLTVKP